MLKKTALIAIFIGATSLIIGGYSALFTEGNVEILMSIDIGDGITCMGSSELDLTGQIHVGIGFENGTVMCLGSWTKNLDPPIRSVVLSGNGRDMVVTDGGNAYWFSTRTGKMKWEKPIKGVAHEISWSKIGPRYVLIISDEESFLISNEGDIVWRGSGGHAAMSYDGWYIALAEGNGLYFYYRDGELLWERSLPSQILEVYCRTGYIAASDDSNINVFDRDGKLKSSVEKMGKYMAVGPRGKIVMSDYPIICQLYSSYLFVVTERGLSCRYESRTKPLWTFPADVVDAAVIDGGPIVLVVDGSRLYFLSGDAVVPGSRVGWFSAIILGMIAVGVYVWEKIELRPTRWGMGMAVIGALVGLFLSLIFGINWILGIVVGTLASFVCWHSEGGFGGVMTGTVAGGLGGFLAGVLSILASWALDYHNPFSTNDIVYAFLWAVVISVMTAIVHRIIKF